VNLSNPNKGTTYCFSTKNNIYPFLLSVSISDNMAFIAGGQDGYGIIIIGRKQ